MSRRAKPGKAKVEAKPTARPKVPENEGNRVSDLEKRLAEALKREAEALEQQAATAEILRVISSSPTDVQPAFDVIVEQACRLCDAVFANAVRIDGELMHNMAAFGFTPEAQAVVRSSFPMRPSRATMSGRAILERAVVVSEDASIDKVGMTSQEISRSLGARAMVSVPMLRDGIAVGAITLARRERGRIPERQIALLKTFAAQAVIAIENVRLFTETKEALERQTATAEILKVISSSPTDVRPVFDAIAESAFRLLSGAVTGVLLRVGDGFRLVAMHSGDQTVGLPPSPEYVPIDPAANFPSRVFLGRRMLHIPDWSAIDLPVHERGVYESMGVRSSLMLPMLREGNCVGVLFVGRASVRAYTDKEIELLQSFVDQAMIAIENVRLVNETKEALEQQTATAEILRVISASPTDIQPVFDAVLDRALTLCEASHGSLYQLEGGTFRHVAARGTFMIGFAVGEVIPLESAPGRAVLEKRTLHIEDALQDLDWVAPEVQAGVRRTGVRTYVAVPLLREQTAIGAILIRRLEVRPFTDKQIRLLQTFADQAVIAIENVRLFKELEERNRAVTESLERQTAAADILRLIGTSPTDAQPVFNGIARGAVRTLGALGCAVFRVDGDMLHVAATHNVRPERMERFRSRFPVPLSSIDEFEQTIRDGIFHLVDIEHNPNATPEDVENAHLGGYRTRLMTPMMRANRALGIIAVTREAAGPFAAEQVQLLQTFADQAVIAIENVRLFTELESRNRDLNATSEILQVISRSPTDVQPVLDAVVESAVRLCAAYDARIWQLDGDRLVRAAGNGPMVEESVDWLPLDSTAPSSVAFLERRTVHFDETQWSANERFRDSQRRTGIQSGVATPLMREGQAIGVLAVRRQQPGRFSDKHVALLQTFADQAVIAIENVRLFTELQQKNAALTQAHAQVTEALEQQTATSEILRVISSSPTDEQPVFDAIVQSAGRLCEATFSGVFLAEAGQLTLAAVQGLDAAGVAAAQAAYPRPVARDTTTGRAVMDRRVVHIEDTWLDSEYTHPLRDTIALRSVLTVPIFREGRPIGAVSVWRGEARPFTDKQIALLQTFADQAVIALENTRLFTELQTSNRELTTALDTQTATSNILRVISGSRTDVQPVFDAIVTSAVRLLRGFVAAMSRIAGDRLELAAFTNSDSAGDAAVRSAFPQLLDSDWPHSRVVRDRVVLNVTDARSDPQLPEAIRNVAVVRGYQSLVVLPMVRHDDAVGAISVTRREPGGFTVDEIALLQTFADQAVIAIENARLLTELQQRNEALTQAHAQVTEALEQQTATSEILRVISRSPGDVQPVFDAIAANAARLCDAVNGLVIRFDGRLLHLAAHYNVDPERLAAVRQSYPRPPSRGALSGRAVLMRAIVHVPDVSKDPEYTLPMATTIGYRSVLAVPMMRDDVVHGTILVARGHVAPFSDTHITLIQTFADQAVIAIENVRLFTELQASNRDLTTALDTQTATSDILRVISRSQTDVQPVFQAIVDSAQRLLQGNSSVMSRIVGDRIELAAYTRTGATADALLGSFFPMPLNAPGSDARPIRKIVIGGRVPYNVADTEKDERVGERGRTNARARGYRSQLVIPMLRHDEAIGTIAVTRREPGGFTDDEIALLQTFADQAVIAIENARLLNELQARTEDLTRSVGELRALGEVGQAISSTLDLETVLRTIVARATQLADADAGVIYEYDEQREVFEPRATERLEDDIVQTLVATPVRKGQGATGRLAEVREPIQLADVRAPGEQLPVRDALIRAGYRALLAVPLVREDHLIGGLTVFRKTPGAFAAAIVDLLKTFATQSSLAIQNARLFREIAQKSRELEVASQHKSEFLASMSHELRTPLNAIIGFSDVLLQGMFGEMSDKQTEYLQDILASGQHLLSLINDILDLSKIEAGRMELDLADFDLPTAVDDALLLMRERAGRRGITLERHVDERVGEISGDQRKVKQVLLNLLSNAVKFTPEGGRIDVRAALADGMAEISVTDTGVGIAPEDHDAVFEEFRQVGKADKKAEGTGLGLALCRKFVELHGGRIWVKSKIGAGSTFTFTLPLSR